MYSLVAHNKKLPAYEDDESIIGYRLIPQHVKIDSLEALGDTLNFIGIWLKLLEDNYDTRRISYITPMKDMLKQIPLTMIKSLTPKQKLQKIMTEIGDG